MKSLRIVVLALFAALLFAGCSGGSGSAPTKGGAGLARKESNKLQNQVYQAQHDVEFRNYNLRQRVADDPSTILWCTFFPATVGQEPITVPIAGKLTSSSKRPYEDIVHTQSGAGGDWFDHENPGPDHMFGSSAEYRYGFDPTLGIYYDFTSLPSVCTTAPLVWQQNKTTVAIQTSATLGSIDKAAQQAIKAGDGAKALKILKQAESK